MATHGASQVAPRTRRSAVSADDPVPAAKITAPGVPERAVRCPRVTKLIAEGVRWCQLTVVSGPAGAGKTTALALWAVAEPGVVAWVGLDEFDNRPGASGLASWRRCASPALSCRGRCRQLCGAGRAIMCSCWSLRRRWRPRTRR